VLLLLPAGNKLNRSFVTLVPPAVVDTADDAHDAAATAAAAKASLASSNIICSD
jgi:hypothetical protein